LVVVRDVFGFENSGAGAQAEGEGVETDGVLPCLRGRTGGMLGILPVGFV
jgi:hypothetical protein